MHPCKITLLSIGTFVIPSASNQKIHLAISVFMGLSVYLSMLSQENVKIRKKLFGKNLNFSLGISDINFSNFLNLFGKLWQNLAKRTPETEQLPLISRFLMISMISVSISIVASVVVLWIHHNGKLKRSVNFSGRERSQESYYFFFDFTSYSEVPKSIRNLFFHPSWRLLFSPQYNMSRQQFELKKIIKNSQTRMRRK